MYEDDGLGNPIGFAVIGHMLGTILFAVAMIPCSDTGVRLSISPYAFGCGLS